MTAGVKIKHKRKAGPFADGELEAGEFGVDIANRTVYFSVDGLSVDQILIGIQASEKGAANGVASLNALAKVPASQLPAPGVPVSEKGAAFGVATLDAQAKVPASQLPAIAPPPPFNASVADQTIAAAQSALLTGSVLAIPATKLRVASLLRWRLTVSKTAAGSAGNTFIVRLGPAGTIADPALLTFLLPAGTADAAVAEVLITVVIRGPLDASCKAQGTLQLSDTLENKGIIVGSIAVVTALSGPFNAAASDLKASVSCTTAAATVLTFHQLEAEALNV